MRYDKQIHVHRTSILAQAAMLPLTAQGRSDVTSPSGHPPFGSRKSFLPDHLSLHKAIGHEMEAVRFQVYGLGVLGFRF